MQCRPKPCRTVETFSSTARACESKILNKISCRSTIISRNLYLTGMTGYMPKYIAIPSELEKIGYMELYPLSIKSKISIIGLLFPISVKFLESLNGSNKLIQNQEIPLQAEFR